MSDIQYADYRLFLSTIAFDALVDKETPDSFEEPGEMDAAGD